jgi:hypothetical protein
MLASKRIRLLALGLVPIGVVASAYAYLSLRPLEVTVAPVVENLPVRVFGLGTVEARVLSKIGFEVGAAITELNADHGDQVKQGQVLARLHATQQQAKVARAKAAVLSAEVAVKKADANVVKAQAILAQRLEVNKRKQQLVSRQVTSTQAGEEAQRDEDVAKAELLVAENDIEVARAQLADASAQLGYEKAVLEQHTLLAPYDALVVDRQKELGTVIKAGDPIFTLVATGSIWALAYIVGTETDHVAPWRSVYKLNLTMDTEMTFLLTSGGHNTGIVSEPGHANRHHRVTTRADTDRHVDPETWLNETPVEEGSWWPEWVRWLESRSGQLSALPTMGAPHRGLEPLAEAPGAYVLRTAGEA